MTPQTPVAEPAEPKADEQAAATENVQSQQNQVVVTNDLA